MLHPIAKRIALLMPVELGRLLESAGLAILTQK
jgi:hypothetical protein